MRADVSGSGFRGYSPRVEASSKLIDRDGTDDVDTVYRHFEKVVRVHVYRSTSYPLPGRISASFRGGFVEAVRKDSTK